MRALSRRPLAPAAVRALAVRIAPALLAVLALLAIVAPGAVLGQDVPRIQGGITDLSGVIDDPTAIRDAQARLFDETQTQLYVVFVPTTGGEDINDYVDRLEARNQGTLTPQDALLLIATEDRDLVLRSGGDLNDRISNTELDQVRDERVIPALRTDDWAGGAVGAAEGLLAALKGNVTPSNPSGQGGGVPIVPIALIILAAGVGIFLWTRLTAARRNRAEAQVQEELGRKASSLLVATDEALRNADQEVGFAEAQFGADAAKTLADAYAAARSELAAAFRISTALDDETPETPEQRRQMLDEIVARCEKANALVAEQKGKLDQLRELGRNAEKVIPDVERRIGETGTRIEATKATLAGFSAYAPSSWAAVAGNADAAAAKTAQASAAVDKAKAAVTANKRDDAAVQVRAAEAALADAATLLSAVDDTQKALAEMTARLKAALAQEHADLAKAEQAVAAGRAKGKEPLLAQAKEKLAQAQGLAAAAPPDVAAATRLVTEADTLLDQVTEDQERALATAQQQMSLASTSIAQARAAVNGGMGGRRALSRLSEAEGYLTRANQLLSVDPVAAAQAAQTADALADEALAEARADSVPSGYTPGYGTGGYGGGGGGGGGGFGDLLTGMILGDMFGSRNRSGGWGGGGVGWGGGTGSGGFGGRRSGGGGGGGGRSSGGGLGGGHRSSGGGGMGGGRRSSGKF